MICPQCKEEIPEDAEVDSDNCIGCPWCGTWFDLTHPAVQRDMWLVENDLELVYTEDVLYEKITERDNLRQMCVDRQDNICVVCGHGMYGDAAVHEAIIKRSDLPNDSRIFTPVNCVALHHTTGCHENTRAVDLKCAKYLIGHYGLGMIVAFIKHLEFKVLPGMAQEIVNIQISESDKEAFYREYRSTLRRKTNG